MRKPGPGRDARPAPERTYDPMSGERPRVTNNDPRRAVEPKAEGELKRRPRRRRPSNGGKGFAAKA